MTALSPQADRMIRAAAHNLIHLAALHGVLPTLETQPRHPLAMGNHSLRLTLRPVRHPDPTAADKCRAPHVLEKLSYHDGARYDMSLEDCLSFLADGWKDTPGRGYTQLVLQLTELLAAAPAQPYCHSDCQAYTEGIERELQALQALHAQAAIRAETLREAASICNGTAGRLEALHKEGKLSCTQGQTWPIEQAAQDILEHAAHVARAAPQPASPAQPAAQHPDDAAVDRFAAAMKDKLAAARAKGRSGWDDPECSQDRLSHMLREHVAKGDPRDVANFCAFLWCRGEAIAPYEASNRDGENYAAGFLQAKGYFPSLSQAFAAGAATAKTAQPAPAQDGRAAAKEGDVAHR